MRRKKKGISTVFLFYRFLLLKVRGEGKRRVWKVVGEKKIVQKFGKKMEHGF